MFGKHWRNYCKVECPVRGWSNNLCVTWKPQWKNYKDRIGIDVNGCKVYDDGVYRLHDGGPNKVPGEMLGPYVT